MKTTRPFNLPATLSLIARVAAGELNHQQAVELADCSHDTWRLRWKRHATPEQRAAVRKRHPGGMRRKPGPMPTPEQIAARAAKVRAQRLAATDYFDPRRHAEVVYRYSGA